MKSRRESTRCCRLLLGLGLIIIASGTALGQAAARPDRGTMPNRSYAVSDIENISLQNGNVGLSIPLAALPPIAGGKLSWTISAHYNSKLWNVTRQQNEDALNDLEWHPYVVDTPQLNDPQGGWRIGGRYMFHFRNIDDDFARVWYPGYSPLDQNQEDEINLNSWRKIVLSMPDGSQHEFRPTDYSGAAYGGPDSIPDFQNLKQIGEIKDRIRVTDSRQLRIQRDAARASGREHVVVTGRYTNVSKTVLIASTVKRLKVLGPGAK